MTFWRSVLIVVAVVIVAGIILLRGVGLAVAFWTAFKYMEYSLWVKVPLATVLILAVGYLFRGLFIAAQIRGKRN